jgi:hypothetical protein
MRRHLSVAILITSVIAATATALIAQNLVLVPGTINGNLSLGGLTLSQVSVNAYPTSGGNSSSVYVYPNATSATYTLTVGVPQSGAQTFNAYAGFYTDQYRDYLQTPTTQVSVSASTPGQADFTLSVGLINASVAVSGGTLSSAFIYASQANGYAYTSASTVNGFTFPMPPGTNINVNGTAYLTDGRQVPLPNQTISVAAGQTTNVSFSVTAPVSSVSGTAKFNGAAPTNQLYLYVNGPLSRSVSYSPVPAGGSYVIDGLANGNYSLNAIAYLNNSDDQFYFPNSAYTPSRNFSINNSEAQVDVAANQSFINTQLSLTGASTFQPWLYSGQISFYGTSTASAGGTSFDALNVTNSSFDSIVSGGTWRQNYVQVAYYRPAPYLYSSFNFYDNRATANVSVNDSATVSRDLEIPLGELTVGVSVSGGALLSSPSLSGSCTYRDDTNAILWSSYVSAYGSANNVSSTQLTFAAPGGTCSLTVSAYVNGSYVSLPASTFVIVPGASQVVDIGGPTLTITQPAADTVVTSNSVTVSGRATDDVAVAAVTVNGTGVALSSNNNPSDPAEVRFQTIVSGLQRGPNVITTVATDTSSPAKTSTDTRTVYYDTAAPTLAFTPANNSSTYATSTSVTGTADDDAGIRKIVVNGNEVSFVSTNNASRPNEVSFSTSVSLSVGANPISVAVTDISNRTSSATHTVTRSQQVPTTLAVAAASATYGGTATLSATLSSNGNGVAGKTITFVLGGQSAAGVTDASGVASVLNFSIAGQNAGSHSGAIAASFAGDNDAAASSATGDLTVSKAAATLSLSNLSQTYNGSPKPAGVSTNPTGLSGVTVTYNGSPSAPTSAGSYSVVASLTNDNYEAPNATGTLVIAKASATLSLSDLSQTYSGSPKPASASTTPTGLSGVSLTYNGSPGAPTNAGSYAVIASLTNDNYEAPNATGTLVIAKASATLSLSNLSQTYNGSPKPVSASTSPIGLTGLSVTYDGSSTAPTNAGSYTVVASLTNDNYEAANAAGTLTIAKANQTITFGALANKTFNDPDFAVTATSSSGLSVTFATAQGQCTVSGNSVHITGAGSCTVRASQSGSDNYNAALNVDQTFTIVKASQAITFLSLANKLVGDTPFTVSATASSGLPVAFSAAGSCTLTGTTVTLTGSNACTITGAQGGNENYLAAASVAQTFYVLQSWSNVLQPINVDGTSIFKLGSTVPVKFRLTGGSAGLVIEARIYVTKYSNGVAGTELEATATNAPDAGNLFRYDATADQYIFNLGTKGMSEGTWQIRIDLLDGAAPRTVFLSLKR